ncbi:hypothetical protein ACJRO7_033528 [Eucalyptus globulus]|uniref:Uncharacterized protein n=1 Tax=Eucalyptus globulus TaxID=34317 RepID=A0ABD3JN01_EUCGL
MREEGGGAGMARVKGRASIDGEPRTLSFHQIKLEAAMYVVNTCTVEEALRIFTETCCIIQGLEPVIYSSNGLDLDEEPNDDDCDELRLLFSRDTISVPF